MEVDYSQEGVPQNLRGYRGKNGTYTKRPFGANLTNIVNNNENQRRLPVKRNSEDADLDEHGPPKKMARYNLRPRTRSAGTASTRMMHGRVKSKQSTEAYKRSNSAELSVSKNMKNMKLEAEEESERKKEEVFEELDMHVATWDEADQQNELKCVHYLPDIMKRLRKAETLYEIGESNDFMKRQSDITARMRRILLDWMIDVHRKFELCSATLYLCVNLLDRYLSLTDVKRSELQLTGCACMWLASKYHEIYAPEINDFVFISDDAFTEQELIVCEGKIVEKLKFTLTVATPLAFAQRFIHIGSHELKKNKDTKVVNFLSHYLLEHGLMHYTLARVKPSKLAASCLAYALLATKLYPKWPHFLVKETGYRLNDLKKYIRILDKIVKLEPKACPHKAVRKKYSYKKVGQVALLNFSTLDIRRWFL